MMNFKKNVLVNSACAYLVACIIVAILELLKIKILVVLDCDISVLIPFAVGYIWYCMQREEDILYRNNDNDNDNSNEEQVQESENNNGQFNSDDIIPQAKTLPASELKHRAEQQRQAEIAAALVSTTSVAAAKTITSSSIESQHDILEPMPEIVSETNITWNIAALEDASFETAESLQDAENLNDILMSKF